MRTFIAIDTPQPLKDKLVAVQAEMKPFRAPVRWVSSDSFHITLKFLGEMAEAKLPVIYDALAKITRPLRPFEISLEGLGSFPPEKNPRVIWVGIRSDKDQLDRLGNWVETSMISLGFPPESRGFHPHLTLGRVKGADNLFRLVTYIQLYSGNQVLGSFVADSLLVYKSTLTPAGPVYEKLQAFPFGQ